MTSVNVKAPAKINLSLDITGKRPDGYHDVSMVLQSVSLYDNVKVSIDNDKTGGEIKITCTDPQIPCDESNIAYKAASAFIKRTGITPYYTEIHIDKNIPSGAGLAGGSTDGAAVIVALNYLYSTHLTDKNMAEIASLVGSDVPFCIYGGTMHATGTGTDLKKITALGKCYFVIVKPDIFVSTKEAYSRCDSKNYKQFIYTDEVIKKICQRNIRAMCDVLYNEFEAVMQLDEINNIKKELRKNKAVGASMSGSGSAVYGIFLEEKKAKACCEKFKNEYDKVYLCEPLKNGCMII